MIALTDEEKSLDGAHAYQTNAVKDKDSNTIKVTQYNVLSSHLAEPNYFQNCSPTFLHPLYRLQELKKKLDVEIENNSILCLQEISTMWAGALHVYVDQDYQDWCFFRWLFLSSAGILCKIFFCHILQ